MRVTYSIWLDASQRSRDGVWVNRSVREVPDRPCYIDQRKCVNRCCRIATVAGVIVHDEVLLTCAVLNAGAFVLPSTYNGALAVGLTSWRKWLLSMYQCLHVSHNTSIGLYNRSRGVILTGRLERNLYVAPRLPWTLLKSLKVHNH